eukprot:5054709-Alexandrium_andersonii.AAC.1
MPSRVLVVATPFRSSRTATRRYCAAACACFLSFSDVQGQRSCDAVSGQGAWNMSRILAMCQTRRHRECSFGRLLGGRLCSQR